MRRCGFLQVAGAGAAGMAGGDTLRNLAESPEHRPTLERLRAVLERWIAE